MTTVCSPKFSSPAWNKTTAGVFQHTNTSLCNYYPWLEVKASLSINSMWKNTVDDLNTSWVT